MSTKSISRFAGKLAFLAAIGLLAAPAMADLTNTIVMNDGFGDSGGAGHGGEFRATPVSFDFTPKSLPLGLGGEADSFETFCIERTEYIGFGKTYYVEINTAAVNGGAGGPNPDPLSGKTAYLYNSFLEGTLNGYVYDASANRFGSSKLDRVESANALQNAIWFLEDEITDVGQGLNSYELTLATEFINDATANGWDTIRNVRVMNLYQYANGTGPAQDQLVAQVPVPGAAMLGMIGLGVISRVKRRLAA